MLVLYPLLRSGLSADTPAALLLAVTLGFSSTVVAAKILEERRELRAFYGRVVIGVLVVQDLVAVVLLDVAGGGTPSPWAALLLALPLARPLIFRFFERSGHEELLLLFGLLLALVGGYGFQVVGLSSELGALLLGVLVAGHPRAVELSDALWGLKELFLVAFFLQIGMTGVPSLTTSASACCSRSCCRSRRRCSSSSRCASGCARARRSWPRCTSRAAASCAHRRRRSRAQRLAHRRLDGHPGRDGRDLHCDVGAAQP
jgi:predicted Kef-type K+ transport protein